MSYPQREFSAPHQFSSYSPEERLAQFRKRFDNFTQDNNDRNKMFFDTRNPFPATRHWQMPNEPFYGNIHSTPVNNYRKATNSMPADDGIPIPVIHEKTNSNPYNNHFNKEEQMSDLETASNGSSGSGSHHSSSDNVLHHGPAKSRSRDSLEAKLEPRVHHIPIRVEPRDRVVNESANVSSEVPLSRSSSGRSSSGISRASNASSPPITVRRSPSPAKSVSSRSGSSASLGSPKERVIPIHMENQNNAVPNSNKVKSNGVGQSTAKPAEGPFVTRIPVNHSEQARQSPVNERKSPSPQPASPKLNPLEEISAILSNLNQLKTEVEAFNNSSNVKQYRFLDEMLTRCMIKLDNVEVNGDEEIRKARKAAINAVHQCIELLESKRNAGQTATQQETSEHDENKVEPQSNDNSMEVCEANTEEKMETETGQTKAMNEKQNGEQSKNENQNECANCNESQKNGEVVQKDVEMNANSKEQEAKHDSSKQEQPMPEETAL